MCTDEHGDATGRNLGVLITGFILGALTGTALGLFFAPKSGRELREEVKEKGGEYYGLAKEKLAEAYEAGKQKGAELKEKVTATAAKVKDSVDTGVKKAKQALKKESEE